MPDAVCGWCGVHAHMPFVGEPVSHVIDVEIYEIRVMATHRCAHCAGLTLSHALLLEQELYETHAIDGETQARTEHRYASRTDQLSWLPPPKAQQRYEHVPHAIANAALEAHNCLAYGANRATAQMARSVIEATAKDKGVTVNRIKPKIDEMYDRGLIREYIRDGAHEIRSLGNDMAHGDFTEPLTTEDAGLVLALMHELLVEVYESPGRVQEAKDRRAAREAARQP